MAFFGLIRDYISPISQENPLQQAIGNVGNLLRARPDLIVPFQNSTAGSMVNPLVQTTPTPTPNWDSVRNNLAIQFRQRQPTPTSIPTSIPNFLSAPINQIKQGFSRWSGVPIDQLEQRIPATRFIPQMVSIANEYKLPQWVFPTFSVLETSGGQHAVYPNNPTNWAVRSGYNPANIEDTLRQMAWSFTNRPSVGTDYLNKYQIPLQKGDLQTFFQSYEPPSQNPNYWTDAQNIMKYFQ